MTAPQPPRVEVTLPPCPFCGGEAKHDGTRYGYPASHWVKCGNCGACSAEYGNREAAARSWTTRTAAEAASRAEVERLREALAWYADQMCEGLCQGKDPQACANIGADNCAGCPAVVALHKAGERTWATA